MPLFKIAHKNILIFNNIHLLCCIHTPIHLFFYIHIISLNYLLFYIRLYSTSSLSLNLLPDSNYLLLIFFPYLKSIYLIPISIFSYNLPFISKILLNYPFKDISSKILSPKHILISRYLFYSSY
jgi:hypothetical protein